MKWLQNLGREGELLDGPEIFIYTSNFVWSEQVIIAIRETESMNLKESKRWSVCVWEGLEGGKAYDVLYFSSKYKKLKLKKLKTKKTKF